ncbi:transcriptional regulator family: Fungal Specific TF [Aspergillus niger]|uniref:Zn(2)-C6 fungal-type domain-containing protein n=1 Tax=Aspergillus niger ATCC 13496 TaxID=1353008 RepID=A0A370BPM4_ASPNG|nr:hypothetical protein ANI_1_2440094 [Aspergillus niger CBS 513.88]KAI2812285.1 transcriptional regulator family: Fungal Specific TF [Aspergillus niger]RDH17503.1 hypothetical protein M747DRAFT_242847 [Aspergillus niger ATCC 13496]KAI2840036.1 transcriptional regulator family: Fungal Specific TF [Aspergillus niger]KAI2842762.1 transcriptional regulator family: Fungal Specific TF [Aspergillus niger]KAI2868434.1 transcriptional regulator family: Fungal Specific TF [Aspergillus niger]|eukprot:XP_001394879.2 hypothetical protein ANI_1_2440094 [Aspergillus niger CBS 513.88]
MVYSGKPSLACERCRPRRLKCDWGKPSCSQCIRAKVDCPGYRSALEYKFRDQSRDVIRKAQLKAERESEEISKRQKRTVKGNSNQMLTYSSSPSSNLSYPTAELAKGYLFVNYIAKGDRGAYMPYLSTLANHLESSAVNDALTAAGLAALSNIYRSRQLMYTARQHYMTALSQTSSSLSHAHLSTRDETLATVVLLSMFEVLTCSDGLFINRWIKHLDGAAILIETRGPEQLTRPEGLALFSQLRTQIVLSHIYRQKHTSAMIRRLSQETAKYRPNKDDAIVDRLSSVTIPLGDLCAAIKEGTISCPSEIVRYALNLDAQIQSIMSDIPASMGYKTVNVALAQGVPTVDTVWGAQYHTYRDITVSSFWNNYRSARLVLLELIVEAIGAMNIHFPGNTKEEHQHLLRECQQISRQLVEDICASVPFHLGSVVDDSHVDKFSGSTTFKSSDANKHRASKPPHLSSESPFGAPAAGGFALMWPLLIAADSGYAPKELRSWIIHCLDKIGHSMGINQALAMAQLVREGESTRAWLSPEYSSPKRDGQEGGSWNEAEAL